MTVLVPLLADQLSDDLASLKAVDPAEAVVLMMEVAGEARHPKHHKGKIALLFAAMRHFADRLRSRGWTVDYIALDDPANGQSFDAEVARAAQRHRPARIVTTEAGDWRVIAAQRGWAALTGVPVELLPDDRFLIGRDAFAHWAEGRKRLVMEDFYRMMRARTGLLMDGADPAGGRWNFDADNRGTPPKGTRFPPVPRFPTDPVRAAVALLVERHFGDHFGVIDLSLWPVTREEAVVALEDFIDHRLARFGDWQDAMVAGEDVLHHSLLSPALNCGLLTPLEVCRAAEAAWHAGEVPLNAAEGFIRQILGWREYVRGIHWIAGPDYPARNHLAATRDLPAFYWTGDTAMRCLAEAVDATRRNAMAHHIQRLMVLGNFALIAGIDPAQVHQWYLVVYADAYEWVEAPNVIGMSQFADGGRLATKPYAASGAYINRMSDYCRGCRYDVKARTGPDACPFNSLYWDFLARNREMLGRNHRLWRSYAGWDRFDAHEQAAIRATAAAVLAALPGAARGWAHDGDGDGALHAAQ